MSSLRALRYFVEEALTSLWRSRLINGLSVATIAVSLFVVGAFLTVAANLDQVVRRWTERIQVTFYLADGADRRLQENLLERLRVHPAVERVQLVGREEALERFRAMFHDLAALPDEVGANPFPASVEVTVRAGDLSEARVLALVAEFEKAAGVEEVQYDLLWIRRLATTVGLIRAVGGLFGGILVLAGVFTISNVIRLTVYARQDELDIMRLVGATPAYVKGPFVVEGVVQGALGGAVAVGLLWGAFRLLATDALAASDLLGRASVALPGAVCLGLVVGGAAVGLVGSLVSLGRSPV